jgi:hypothetical protein
MQGETSMTPALRDGEPLRSGDTRSELLETRLFTLLGLVNDWLKFAETKNGAIVTGSGAALTLLLNKLGDSESISATAWVLVGTGGTCLLISLLAGLLSFFPLNRSPRASRRRTADAYASDNLYYFGHLAAYEASELAAELNHRYFNAPVDATAGPAALEIAMQVIINARITVWKLSLFRFSLALFGAGFTVSVIGVTAIVIP